MSAAERLTVVFERLQREGRVGLMTHLVLGYPSLEESREIVECMVAAGVDLIEVQIPFSDPTADGPVITAACQEALDGGVRLVDAWEFLRDATARHGIPFLVMSYFNVVFSYRTAAHGDPSEVGVRGFTRQAASCGAAGLIVPDIPPEQTQEGYPEACREAGLHPIYVVSPNTSDARLGLIRTAASGFLYATSRTGTTGKEMDLETERLFSFLARARRVSGLPLAVGFSISRREQVEQLRGHAEVAVVGTHLIRAYRDGGLESLGKALRALTGKTG